MEQNATAVRVRFKRVNNVVDLVDGFAILSRPRSPLLTINRPKIAILGCPLIPDFDTILLEPFGVGITIQEPDHLIDDALEMQFLRGQQWEAIFQVVAELTTKHAQRACPCAIAFLDAVPSTSASKSWYIFISDPLDLR